MRVAIMSRVFALILWDGQSFRGLMRVLFPGPWRKKRRLAQRG